MMDDIILPELGQDTERLPNMKKKNKMGRPLMATMGETAEELRLTQDKATSHEEKISIKDIKGCELDNIEVI